MIIIKAKIINFDNKIKKGNGSLIENRDCCVNESGRYSFPETKKIEQFFHLFKTAEDLLVNSVTHIVQAIGRFT